MSQKLFVRLSDVDRAALLKMTRSGVGKAREITRARVLLLADRNQEGWKTQEQIAQALGVSPVTVSRLCRRFVLEGRQQALKERPRPGQAPKITGEVEAHLLALACSKPPEGKARWTVRLLRDEMVRLEVVEDVSHVALFNALKKTKSSRGRSSPGA
jgi:transposase